MLITLYTPAKDLLSTLVTLKTIFDAKDIEFIKPLKSILHPINISLRSRIGDSQIQITLIEFSLLGIFTEINF